MTPLSSRPETSAAQGLKSCNRCGLCCAANPCLLEPGDVERIAAHVGETVREFARSLQLEVTPAGHKLVRLRQPCRFLAGTECTIQAHKPKGGAEFECWTPSTYRKTYAWPRAAARALVRAAT